MYSTLIQAARKGRLYDVILLSSQGAEFNTQNVGALTVAAENGRLEVIEYLIEHGANIHVSGLLAGLRREKMDKKRKKKRW